MPDGTLRPSNKSIVVAGANPGSLAFTLDDNTLSARHIIAGDVAVITAIQDRPPAIHDLVVALVNGRLGAYRYRPPFLIAESLETWPSIPVDDAVVLGTITQIVRTL